MLDKSKVSKNSISSEQWVELLLAILTNLREHDVVSVEALATQLNIDESKLRKQLDTLLYVGVPPFGGGDLLPIDFDEDGYLIMTGKMSAMDQPLRLTSVEAQALLLALRIAGFTADDLLVRKLSDAITADFDSATFEQLIHIGRTSHNSKHFQVAARALDEGLLLQGVYTNRKGESKNRVIEPCWLFAEGDHWYLHAHTKESGKPSELRNFRLEKFSELEVASEDLAYAGASHEPRPDSSTMPTALNVESLPYACRIRFANRDDFNPEDWFGAEVLDSSEDTNAIEISFPHSNNKWVASKVVAQLGKAEVVAPPELREEVRRTAAALLG